MGEYLIVICLADNDLLLQLGAWNLLTEFQAFLQTKWNAAPSDIYILNGLVRRLQQENSRWERQYGRPALDRVARFCEGLSRVYDLPHSAEVVIALSEVEKIDEGEAVLIAVAVQHPGSLILTNEWNFLSALSDPACTPYREALQGRVLHLRQIIYHFLTDKGFRALEPRIKQAPRSDGRIYQVFQGSAGRAQQDLRDAVEEVERIALGMLVVFEEV
jgi:hypothetical protein